MYNIAYWIKTHIFFLIIPVFSFFVPVCVITSHAAGQARIHYLTLPGSTEAILLECNGQFGMVDSGEDTDYPDGSDPRYPDRPGIAKTEGFESEVIAYLYKCGVTSDNFEFYIGTHPHSDHIGSADEIIREFHPKRVYIQEYKDEYITNENSLWDNLYVYDQMLRAAQDTGATIIQNFDPDAPLYPEKISIQGIITWDDGENQDNIRPDEVTVILTNLNTSEITTCQSTPDETGVWTYSFEKLQQYDESKEPIPYQVSLTVPDGYNITNPENAYDFVCSHTPVSVDSAVHIIWDDEQTLGEFRPSTLEIEVCKTLISPENADIADESMNTGNESDEETAFDETGTSYSLSSDKYGVWELSLEDIETDKENADLSEYHINVLNEPENYTFEIQEEELAIIAHYTGDDILPETAHDNVSVAEAENHGTSDEMETSLIPESDQVDYETFLMLTSDENTFYAGSNKSGQEGQFNELDQIQNTTSTPNFTLGNDMKLKIMHYGNDYKTSHKPDANYFSLGVLVEVNGKTAFLSGDINNFEGTETALAKELGHVDILTLGHHGHYGSNTYGYVTGLAPQIMVLPGSFQAITNTSSSYDATGTLDTLIAMGQKGIPLYVTSWYRCTIDAFVFNFDENLSSNIPKSIAYIADATKLSPVEYIYYVDGLPTVYTGWMTLNGYTRYFNNSMFSSKSELIKTESGNYIYLDENSEAKTGWAKYQNKWYYLTNDGYLLTGWQKINGITYYFNWDGAMKTGWLYTENRWYYFDLSGMMLTGWQTLNGSRYYFSQNGIMKTGWAHTATNWYYFDSNGSMAIGWRKISNIWYYMDTNGHMLTGWQKINGKWYYLNENGSMATGWREISNSWYYMDNSGVMLTGWLKNNGNWYYLTSSGAMATGWCKVSDTWYYMSSSGIMLTGWQKINGKSYYMYSSGAMAANTRIGKYYVDSSGAWIPDAE